MYISDQIDFLTVAYEDYCTKHQLPYVSADEQDYMPEHDAWLTKFSEMWDLAVDS